MKRAVSVLFLALLLTGCGGDSSEPEADESGATTEAATVEVEAGTCLAGEVDDSGDKAPDLTTVVDCSEPHVYEITAVVDVPDSLLSGETDQERLDNRTELATPVDGEPSAAKAEYGAFTDEACADGALATVGWEGLSLQGVGADDAQVLPMVGSGTPVWVNLMPEEEWLAGRTQVLCSARFSEPVLTETGEATSVPAAAPVSSPDADPMLSHFPTQEFPADLRACELAAADGTRTYLGCDAEHYAEFLFSYDALAVLGAEFVSGLDPANVTDEQYAAIDQVCTDVLDELLPGHDPKTFKGLGELGAQGWGTVDAAYYQGQCTVAAEDSLNFNLPAGSLMGTDGAGVEPVPFES